ncbi:hypothetical protein MYX82_07540 [Acidobacteria bacterium AH-259-D05]|nr:hypothetical protein [Acidobacteria bacterium AH-259-D05]
MALIPYPDLENLEPEAQRIIDAFVKEHGRPTPLYAMMAHFGPALRTTSSMYTSVMSKGKFDRRFKELLFVAASDVRNCFY